MTPLSLTTALLTSLFAANVVPAALDDGYKLGPDSMRQADTPRGQVFGPLTLESKKVWPGTTRNYWVYVPAQYDGHAPASLMVFQDGHFFVNCTDAGQYRIPIVFDNLIYRREMPVTIAVFINPGRTAQQTESTDSEWGDKTNNRVVEYNTLDGKYASLLIDELLPSLELRYNLSSNPDDHAIAGASSGAICAFTAAWQRPDVFRKVISTIGSFTNIRGGDAYPDLVLQSDRKPIRVFLQDGVNDLRGKLKQPDGSLGYDPKMDWHAQNLRMADALTRRGYDVNYTWGIGSHSNKQGGAIMPDMLRWLWRDYSRTDNPHDAGNRQLFNAPPATTQHSIP